MIAPSPAPASYRLLDPSVKVSLKDYFTATQDPSLISGSCFEYFVYDAANIALVTTYPAFISYAAPDMTLQSTTPGQISTAQELHSFNFAARIKIDGQLV